MEEKIVNVLSSLLAFCIRTPLYLLPKEARIKKMKQAQIWLNNASLRLSKFHWD